MNNRIPPNTPPPSNAPGEDQSSTSTGRELPDQLISKLKVEVEGYQLIERLGAGGQATVYRARRIKDGLIVAVKILHAGPHADEQARARLRREVHALRALNHPNIVHAVAAGRTRSGLDCLVMNYIDGRSLDALWEDGTFAAAVAPEPPARLRLFKQICETVQAAHRKGITHRDLSPSNILIDANGQPHILDFGMASTAFNGILSAAGRNVTVTGQFIGKIKYASPEQAGGSRDVVDIRSDVYALGVMLYQLLTDGAFPYEVVGNVIDVLNNIIHSKPRPLKHMLAGPSADRTVTYPARGSAPARPPLRRNPPLVNETIEAIVLKALEKEPDQRYQSAGELAADIEHYLAGRPTSANVWPRTTALSRLGRRRKVAVAAIVVIVSLVVGGIAMNARTLSAWFGILTSAAPLAAPTQVAAEDPAALNRLNELSSNLAIIEARLYAVNKQLVAIGHDVPEINIDAARTDGETANDAGQQTGPLKVGEFCAEIARVAATEKPLVFEPVVPDVIKGAEAAESATISQVTDLETLIARRNQLQDEQSSHWLQVAWYAMAYRETTAKQLYRYKLARDRDANAADKARKEIVEKGVEAVRVLDAATQSQLESLKGGIGDADQGVDKQNEESVSPATQAAADVFTASDLPFANLASAALDAKDATEISPEDKNQIDEFRDIAQRLRAELQTAKDALTESFAISQEHKRYLARGRLQKKVIDSVDLLAQLDGKLTALADAWKMELDTSRKLSLVTPTARKSKPRAEKRRPEKELAVKEAPKSAPIELRRGDKLTGLLTWQNAIRPGSLTVTATIEDITNRSAVVRVNNGLAVWDYVLELDGNRATLLDLRLQSTSTNNRVSAWDVRGNVSATGIDVSGAWTAIQPNGIRTRDQIQLTLTKAK